MNDPALKVVVPTNTYYLGANAAISTYFTVTGLTKKSGAQINIVANATSSGIVYSSSVGSAITVASNEFVYKYQQQGGLIGSTLKQTNLNAYT